MTQENGIQTESTARADLLAEIDCFKSTYLHPDRLASLTIDSYNLIDDWPKEDKSWPHGASAGIYTIYDAAWKLLYIGKASMNSCIAARLSNYFLAARRSHACRRMTGADIHPAIFWPCPCLRRRNSWPQRWRNF